MKNLAITLAAFLVSFTVHAVAPMMGTGFVCVGATITYTDPTPGGTWSVSDTTIATVDATGHVTGRSAGIATVSYTVGGSSALGGLTVKPTPNVYTVTGGGSYCVNTGTGSMVGSGGPIGLSGSQIGVSYSASFPGYTASTLPGTGSPLNFGNVLAGVYSVTATQTYSGYGSTGSCSSTMNGTATVVMNPTPPITGPGGVCTGGHVTLSDSMPGGTWSSQYTSIATIGATTGIVTGVAATNVTITYSAPTGCYAVTNFWVTAHPTTILGSKSLCTGTPSSLWSDANYGLWTSSNPTVAAINSSGSVTPFAAGTATITYNLGSTACTVTTPITVNTSPTGISGSAYLCAGQSTTLTGAPAGGTWSTTTPYYATVGAGTGILTAMSPGVATIAYTIGSACTAYKQITINATASPITGPSTLCIGEVETYASAPVGGNFSSSAPSVATVGLSSGVVTGVAVGAFTLSYSMGAGCSATKTITVNPTTCSGTPSAGTTIASASILCVNGLLTLSLAGSSTGCGILHQWQSSTDNVTFTDISAATAATCNINVTNSLYYRCKVTCSNSGLPAYSPPVYVAMHSTISYFHVFDSLCNSPNFYIAACGSSPSYNVTTWFGDGTYVNSPLTSSGTASANVFHTYNSAGTYTVKQVLYIGTAKQDSVSYTYTHSNCNSVPIKFYYDANHNGVFDSSEPPSLLPVVTEIDSNGVAIDSVSTTSGFYYKARGGPGTVYTFRVMSPPTGMTVASPVSGLFRDTIKTLSSTLPQQDFGLLCASGTFPHLAQYAAVQTGRHAQWGSLTVTGHAYCTPVPVSVTLHHSPKYDFNSATPVPTSTSLSTVVWNLAPGADATYPMINYRLEVPSTWLVPGDTVNSSYFTIDTMITDTANHYLIRNDTVKSSFDPNEIEVSPMGNVLPCMPLQYTIRFANTGNDTAKNITIVDTLSDNVDVQSLKVQTASSQMNVTVIKGAHNILKLDLPGINLPDSAHSQSYSGLVVFDINVKPGTADGSAIFNQAGIIFDDNPPVTTNIVENVSGVAPITGSNSVCESASDTLSNTMAGGIWSVSNANATLSEGVVHGISAGPATISYTVSNSCVSRTVTRLITINPLPSAGTITGANSLCVDLTTTLGNATGGGTWSIGTTGSATISSGGTVNGIAAGNATISYTVANGCGTAVATKTLTVNPLPASISGSVSICAGATTLLTDITVGGTWGCGSSVASINSSGLVNGISAGSAVLTYSLPTGCSRTFTLNVNTLPVTHNITGGGAYCAGGTGRHVGLSGSETGVTYTLYNGTATAGSFAGTGAAVDMGAQSTPGIYTIVANAGTSCSSNMTGSAVVSVSPLPTTYNITGGGAYCSGGTGLHIGLNGSTNGISYTLYKDGATAGTFAGTGAPMDMGAQTVAGIYTISATDPLTTCTNAMTGSANISVNPLPAAIGGNGTLCAGSTTALTDANPGGTWSGSSTIATIDAGGTVTALLPGTTTMTYILPTGCSASKTINVLTSPAVYNVTGGGAYCAGSGGVHVGLNNSETGITYTLYNSSVAAGMFAGTGSAIDMGVLSAAGDYTVMASNSTTSCANLMSGHASVVVNPLPASISADVTTLCASVTSTYRDATAGGTWSTGVSGVVSVDGSGLVTALSPGTTSVDYALPTGCSVSQTVVVNALPNPHNVTGGGSYCAGGHGVPVGLANSEPGIIYSLYEGATMIGTFAGTGSPVDMGLQTNAGTYTVTALNTATFCTNSMTGSASVVENPLPAAISGITPLCENQSLTLTDAVPGGAWSATAGVSISTGGVLTATAAGMATVTYTLPTGCFSAAAVIVNQAPATFNVTGGGNYCSGDAGVRVGLDGSSTAVTYTLYNSGVAIGTFIGTGSPIDFGVHTAAGTYTVGGIISGSGCRNDMAGVAVVGINAAPDAITGSSSVCVNGSVTLASTTPSGSWTSSTPSVATVDAGTGTVTAVAAGTTTIWYTLPTGCKTSKVITTKALPAVYNLTGGGDYCAGTAGVHIGLNNSQTGVTYNLQTGSTTATTRTGTGGALDFGLQTAVGTYTVAATNNQSCSNSMHGTATVGIVSDVSPSISITSDAGTSFCKGSEVTFNAHPTNGGTSPRYRWQVNGIYAGNSSSYQYRPHEGDVVTSELTSNALCALPATASASITMHEIAQSAPTLTITGNPGLSIEPGQTLTLQANVSGAGSALEYQWVINTSYIAGATQSTYTSNSFANNDSLTCIIVTGNGCGTVLGSATVAIGVGTTGIASLAKEGDIQLQPNPNSGSFSIIGTVPDVSGEINVTVTNALGQTVYSGKSQIRNGNIDAAISLDKNLASGTYLLKLQSGDYSKVLHFVITR